MIILRRNVHYYSLLLFFLSVNTLVEMDAEGMANVGLSQNEYFREITSTVYVGDVS